MRILMLTAIFPPEIRSQAHLFHELALELRRRGHEVAVITKIPTYYVSNGADEGITPGWSDAEGIQVLRIRGFPLTGRQPFIRAMEHLTLGLRFGRASRRWPAADGVLVYSPPLPLAFSAAKYERKFGAPFILNVQDLYPQTAVDLGLLRNPVAVRLAESMELKAYQRASRIVVHSPGNRAFLLEKRNVPSGKVRVIYNWVDIEAIRPGSRDNRFRAEHQLEGKFVISYAGLMGYAQDLGSIIECADHMRRESDVIFLLVGEGVLEPRWRQMVRDRDLQNVYFLPLQEKGKYNELLAASDVCLVPLSGSLRTPVVPGKLQSIMASGRPVITIVDPEGDTPKLIDESGGGINVPPGQPMPLAEAISQLKSDTGSREEMGRRGRAFATAHFSLKRCADTYENLFAEILKEKAQRESMSDGGRL